MAPHRRSGPEEHVAKGHSPAVTPAVTIVMANFNGAAFIEAALHSALGQSLRDIEIVVADDASTDDSVARVTAIATADSRVRLRRSPVNAGPAAARNLCLEAARGRWIAVMDSDDLMHPERLERLIAAAERDGADIAPPPSRGSWPTAPCAPSTAPRHCTSPARGFPPKRAMPN